jgi:hypothetical protein
MRRLTILVVLGLALAVGAEAGPKTAKPNNAPKPTITKTQAPKAPKAATPKGPTSKGSTVKMTGTQMKGSTFKGKGAQANVSTGKSKGAQATVASGKSTKPAKGDTKFAKADTKTPKTSAKSAETGSTTKKKTTTTTSSGTPTSTSNTPPSTHTPTAPIDFTATSLGQKLQKNSAIRSKIEAKLLAAGYTGSVYEAAYGFKNLGQLNAATNQVQNQGYSFDLLKVLMTGTYVDPQTHVAYRANQGTDGTTTLVRTGLATDPASTQSLGQAKQAIAGGAEMPAIDLTHTSGAPTTTGTTPTGTVTVSGTVSTSSATAASKKRQSKSR